MLAVEVKSCGGLYELIPYDLNQPLLANYLYFLGLRGKNKY